MLMVEIDEKGHAVRYPDYEKIKQKELENCGYYLIRIDSDKKDFNDYEEFGRVSAYITESVKKQTEESAKKSLIDDFPKIILWLEFKSNHSIKSKSLIKMDCQKKYCQMIKTTGKKIRKMNIPRKENMEHTYCVSCKRYTGNSDMSSKTIDNKVNLPKSGCLQCEHDKSMFLKQKLTSRK